MVGIFNIVLDSDMLLPELQDVNSTGTVVTIRNKSHAEKWPMQPDWFHHWETPDGDICISCAKVDDAYLLRFPELSDFLISIPESKIYYAPESGVPDETVRHLLLDQVIPRMLGQNGAIILHAAAVQLPSGKTVAFVANSGGGKSTLASSFLSDGATLISDDCLLLEVVDGEVIAIPNYHGLRLYDDSAQAIFGDTPASSAVAHYTSKKRLKLSARPVPGEAIAIPLDAIFMLADEDEDTDGVFVDSISGINELMAMIEQTFLLDLKDKPRIAQQFQFMGKLVVSKLPLYRLTYPRKHAALAEVRASVATIL